MDKRLASRSVILTRKIHAACTFAFILLQLFVPSSVSFAQGNDLQDSEMLVAGVSQLASGGSPGSLLDTSGDWTVVVNGDEDASFPSFFAMGRSFGSGRILSLGHEGLLASMGILDNQRFAGNVVNWLDNNSSKTVGITKGHREFASNLQDFESSLTASGFTVSDIPGTITPGVLTGTSVLVISNAWQAFSDSEITAIRDYVDAGGGLLLAGLGWSFASSIDREPLAYPMNILGAGFGIRWLQNVIQDPTDFLDDGSNSPIFSKFLSDAISNIEQAISALTQIHTANGTNLPTLLQQDTVAKERFTQAHDFIGSFVTVIEDDSVSRQRINTALLEFVRTYPFFYARGAAFDAQAIPVAVNYRERFWRTWRDTLPLSEQRISDMVEFGLLSRTRESLLRDFSVIVLDNESASNAQLDQIRTYFEFIPNALIDLRTISIRDFLGNGIDNSFLQGRGFSVNIFGVNIGEQSENAFPDDVTPGVIDLYSAALAHEMNHIVDAFYVENDDVLKATKERLLADAGRPAQNYLRSMFADGFFADAPQEFIASISNQWFQDSAKTVELGLVRFDDDVVHPINQALLMAQIYSSGRDHTWFYTTDINGRTTRLWVPLSRGASGFINELDVSGRRLTFNFDGDGRVTSYNATPFADSDEDGIADDRDNCESVANPVQEDDNQNGIGDACETPDELKVSVHDLGVGEGDGTVMALISLSAPARTAISFKVHSRPDTAINGQDYYGFTRPMSFAPGESETRVPITILDDTEIEGEEQFLIRLYEVPADLIVERRVATVTIKDNEDPSKKLPSVSVQDLVVKEGDRYANVIVNLSRTSRVPVSVKIHTRVSHTGARNATPGKDYYGFTRELRFAPGQSEISIRIQILDDKVPERLESFTLRLFAVQEDRARIAKEFSSVTIMDDDN